MRKMCSRPLALRASRNASAPSFTGSSATCGSLLHCVLDVTQHLRKTMPDHAAERDAHDLGTVSYCSFSLLGRCHHSIEGQAGGENLALRRLYGPDDFGVVGPPLVTHAVRQVDLTDADGIHTLGVPDVFEI